MAFTHVHITLQHLGLTDDQAILFDRVASRVFGCRRVCISPADLARNTLGQSNLWGYGISGDLPIVLVRVSEAAGAAARAAAAARAGILACEGAARRSRDPERASRGIPRRGAAASRRAGRGAPLVGVEGQAGRHLPAALGRDGRSGSPSAGGGGARRAARRSRRSGDRSCDRPAPWLYREQFMPRVRGRRAARAGIQRRCRSRRWSWRTGSGGFTPDGREYVVVLEGDRETPLPWSNVLANPDFGTMVSASGSAFTWAEKQPREPADAVRQRSGRPIRRARRSFFATTTTGAVWGATPAPLPRRPDAGRWVVRHARRRRRVISTRLPAWSRSWRSSSRQTIP